MPSTKGGSLNGGVVGKTNKSSFGANAVTTKTASGSITTRSGTTQIEYLVIAGGGGGGLAAGTGGGGAGGYRSSVAGETSGGGASAEPSVSITAGATLTATVGAGGAFPSGTAQLTPAAKKIMSNIAEVNKKGNSNIKVTGHTDNVPLLFGSQYRDNWDLAAARAASVVQSLHETNVIDAKRLIATSKGETQPIASNQTRQGRSKNRRIEIEINYGK